MDRPVRIFADARSRRTTLLAIAVVLAVLIGGSIALRGHVAWLTDPDATRSFVAEFGPLAPIAFVLLQAAQVVFAPVPGQVLAVASGWLFGLFWGTVYSVVGATLGSYVVFRVARRYGRPFVERAIDPAALALFDGFSERRGYLVLAVLFIVPGMPDDVICFVAGTTRLDIKRMTVIVALGRVPGYLLANAIGASLAAQLYAEATVLLLALVAASALVYWYRDAVFDRLLATVR
ncbi:TVP38/TMEM64 family protein [Halapricum desulfuricans]|uniref:Membrane protein DegA family n=1 Tax=Halapricum desulfuricans TaxID=2841257 RepID=A0A897N8Z4_9EURY|nr:TVP38/TMEM64 family protein [Halapricum desulfuricans]QSG06856.1 Membrane protein DegA family [Halapricum desulfuricans]